MPSLPTAAGLSGLAGLSVLTAGLPAGLSGLPAGLAGLSAAPACYFCIGDSIVGAVVAAGDHDLDKSSFYCPLFASAAALGKGKAASTPFFFAKAAAPPPTAFKSLNPFGRTVLSTSGFATGAGGGVGGGGGFADPPIDCGKPPRRCPSDLSKTELELWKLIEELRTNTALDHMDLRKRISDLSDEVNKSHAVRRDAVSVARREVGVIAYRMFVTFGVMGMGSYFVINDMMQREISNAFCDVRDKISKAQEKIKNIEERYKADHKEGSKSAAQ